MYILIDYFACLVYNTFNNTKEVDDMTLGDLIKAYCDEHKMSLQTFADNAHASKGYISMLINGKNPSTGKPPIPTIKKLTGIAEAMGTTVQEAESSNLSTQTTKSPENIEFSGLLLFL